jgi:hypothetical protein
MRNLGTNRNRIALTIPVDPRHLAAGRKNEVSLAATTRGKVLTMPVGLPFATSSGRDLTDKPRRIPKSVQLACLDMIHRGIDFVEAARANGIKPDTLRRHLHRIETIGFIRRERQVLRTALCSSNEHYLALIRNSSENAMARTKAIALLEAIDDEARARPARSGEVPSPGVVLNIVTYQTPPPAVVSRQPEPPALQITDAGES